MKTKILWIFTIIFTMIAVSSCNVQKKLNEVQPSQDIAKNKELNEVQPSQDDTQNNELNEVQPSQDDIQNTELNEMQPSQDDNKKNKKFIPHISRAAVKEGTTVCYREGRNLMCKSGSNAPVTIAKNIVSQFMLFHQKVYYFTKHSEPSGHLDLHIADIDSQQDTLMICGADTDPIIYDFGNKPFIGAYKNSIYLLLYGEDEAYHIMMITESKSRELYEPVDLDSYHFAAILEGQLFFVTDNPDSSEESNRQIIYKIDLDKEEKSVETITTCRLPRGNYTQNMFLADYNNNVIYCLNELYAEGDSFEVEIMRIDKTGAVESLITKEEPIGLSFPMDGNVVYYCVKSKIYEQMGQKFFNSGPGKWADQIVYHKKKCYWYESDSDEGFGAIYCYDGEESFPLIDVNFHICDMTVTGQTLYFCCMTYEGEKEIGFSMPLRKLHKKEQQKFSKKLKDYKWNHEEKAEEKVLEKLIKALPDK